MKKVIFIIGFLFTSTTFAADPYSQYNQYNRQYTVNSNQQYGSTNWYSSPLGMGVAQAGVALIGGLVNVMSRPDPVQYTQPQQQPIYVGNRQQTVASSNEPVVRQSSDPNCVVIERPNNNGTPTYEKYCQ